MKKSEVKEDLIDQLIAKGKHQSFYTDLVDDYMKYWDLFEIKDYAMKSHRVMVLSAKSLMNPYRIS